MDMLVTSRGFMFGFVYIYYNILWWPSGKQDKWVSIDEQNIFLWSLDSSKKAAQVQSQQSSGMLQLLSGGAWDPHDVNSVAATCDSSLHLWDVRTLKLQQRMNLEYTYETLGCVVHLWRRSLDTHWTWTVKCNPEYNGMILSAGTNSTVNLWLTSPTSSGEKTSESAPTRMVESSTQNNHLTHTMTMKIVFMARLGVLVSSRSLHHYLMMDG